MTVRDTFLLIVGTAFTVALIVIGLRSAPDFSFDDWLRGRMGDEVRRARVVPYPPPPPVARPKIAATAVEAAAPPAESPKPAVVAAEAPPAPEPRKIARGERVNMIEQVHIAQVVNPTPVADESVEVTEGAVCDARGYGTMTVVGFDGNRILVRYHRAVRQKGRLRYADEEAGQYPDCPSGTLFFIATDHYRKIARPMETAKVKALLEQER